MWPGRRYWLWSFRIWGILFVGFLSLGVYFGGEGDMLVVVEWTELWAMTTGFVALVLLSGRVATRVARRSR